MDTTLNSRTPTREDFFLTSDGYRQQKDNSWGQASISHYNLSLLQEGNVIVGEIIKNVYTGNLAEGTVIDSAYVMASTVDNDDDDEMLGLVAAYDEAKTLPSDTVSFADALKALSDRRKGM